MKVISHHLIQKIPPLFVPLICYMAAIGCYWHYYTHKLSFSSTGLLVALGFVAPLLVYRQQPRYLCYIFCAFALGVLRTYYIVDHYDKITTAYYKKNSKIVGIVDDIKRFPYRRFPHVVTIQVQKISCDTKSHAYPGLLEIHMIRRPDISVGSTLLLEDISLKKVDLNNPFALYQMKENILNSIFMVKNNYTVLQKDESSIFYKLFCLRSRIRASFKAALRPETFGLFASLFLGEKEESSVYKDEIGAVFKQWGIVHYLARSGLHLVVIVSLLEKFIRLLAIPFVIKHCLLLLAACVYFILTWPSISFIRSFILFCLYKCFLFGRIPQHYMNTLLLCTLFVLLYNPLQLFFLDFQLSFGLTFALAWINQFNSTRPLISLQKY